ncbi:MAG: PAS domain S-box protein [Chloroherpetonaceae bacterium]|nr:PAS domain S-box protein [Chloroherpetonaceae bacterium]MCS7211910.1 PAS domain S-box protein [Chloroherpetonaceae bacterium]MDW8018675.1 PAS domain S-box protein [Chloroherpetonaceae bacterium]MDW8466280.1 PAS domain S-box protein [Chloroherpetonaceae bacterium]
MPIDELLQESEKLFLLIYESAKIGVCITDEHGYFVAVNKFYCQLYGYSEGELVGQHFTMVLPEPQRDSARRIHDAFIAGSPDSAGEWRVRRKDGTEMQVYVTAEWLVTRTGKRYKVTTVTPISDLRYLDSMDYLEKVREESQLQALRDTMTTVTDIVFNGLQTMVFIRAKLEQNRATPEEIKRFDETIRRITERLNALANVQRYETKQIADGIHVIDYGKHYARTDKQS